MLNCTSCKVKLSRKNVMFSKTWDLNDKSGLVSNGHRHTLKLCPPCAMALLHLALDYMQETDLRRVISKMGTSHERRPD